MSGGLLQLVAYGAQDIYLSGNPVITYFKVIYRRHTNFALESIQQTFGGPVDWGARVSSVISRQGDLIAGMMLEASIPAVAGQVPGNVYSFVTWTDNLGHFLIDSANLTIGGQLIDRQYGDWLEIWAQLTVTAGQMTGYREMIGQDPPLPFGVNTGLQAPTQGNLPARQVYVPLQFWFCRNPGLALPLIALQHHEVRVTIQFRGLGQVLNAFDASTRTGALWPTPLTGGTYPVVAPLQANLWVDYVYLDTEERRRFAQMSHEYLIEQVQYNGIWIAPASTAVQTVSVPINFVNPVKELIWVCQYASAISGGFTQLSNYTDISAINWPQTAVGSILTLSTTGTSSGLGAVNLDETLTTVGSDVTGNLVGLTNQSHINPPGSNNPVQYANLQLNGMDRFTSRDGNYFNLIQTYDHHTNIPLSPGINVYSFALRPELHQPTGSCNFSRIETATLTMTLSPGQITSIGSDSYSITNNFNNSNIYVRVYATNYNVLRIMSGLCGLAYG